jgi:hypothetical protein
MYSSLVEVRFHSLDNKRNNYCNFDHMPERIAMQVRFRIGAALWVIQMFSAINRESGGRQVAAPVAYNDPFFRQFQFFKCTGKR